MSKHIQTLLLCTTLVVIGVFMHIGDSEQGIQIDEQTWIDRGQDFAKQLGFGANGYKIRTKMSSLKYANQTNGPTIKSHHPGYVTAMIFAVGMSILPDNPTINQLLWLRYVQGASLVLISLFVFLLLKTIDVQQSISFIAAIILLTSPAIVGESRLIKQDILSLMFIMFSVISFLIYIDKHSSFWLVASALSSGLAIMTKFVSILPLSPIAFWFLFMCVRQHNKHIWRDSLLWLSIIYGVIMLISTNTYNHPLSAPFIISNTVMSSSQVTLEKPPFVENIIHTLSLMAYISPLFIIVFGIAILGLFRLKNMSSILRERYFIVGICAIFALLIPFMSAVKCPRYIFPALGLIVIAASLSLNTFGVKRYNALLIVVFVLCLHVTEFIRFYPYNSIYHWPNVSFSNVRTTRSIMMPQIAKKLDDMGIENVNVMTGHNTLQYYYNGEAVFSPKLNSDWILLSDKYIDLAPVSYGDPVREFSFMNQTIYSLFRKPIVEK